MRKIFKVLVLSLLLVLGRTSNASAEIQPRCKALHEMKWSGFRIDVAEMQRVSRERPAHCVVQGTIDTEINFELLLPVSNAWNGRLVMGGGAGFAGSIQNQALDFAPDLLKEGFATVGTDTGHRGAGTQASWAYNREDREINFGHRAVHLTAQAAKTIIRLHYDRDITYAYFIGCSRGGGQALMASQRYPDDFDGIVAGAPAFNWSGIAAQYIQNAQAMYEDRNGVRVPIVRPETQQLLEDAILEKCDALDQLEDGILSDPRKCTFKLADLPLCKGDIAKAGCVTSKELHAIKAVYAGPVVDEEQVHPGFPFGGEAQADGWNAWVVGREDGFGPGRPSLQFAMGMELFKYIVFDDRDWDYTAYDFSNWQEDIRRTARLLDATDADLSHFNVSNGKIIYWTGWSDAALTANGIVEYFEQVQEKTRSAEDFTRLFMLPGVGHCGGGPGPDTVDWLSTIQDWVEHNKAPNQVVATKMEAGEIIMQRPLCAYPMESVYNGKGDGSGLESFECGHHR